jgi:hypothetical protein
MRDRKEYATARRNERRKRAFELKGSKCFECGYTGPSYHFDYHHRDPNKDAKMKLSKLWNHKWEYLIAEIEKCDLLCAICHRDRHMSEYKDNV